MEAEPGALIGPYRISHPIGKGGMGQVFAAVHTSSGLSVALKLLRKEAAEDRQLVRRFVEEYKTLAKLEHPNIVKVFGGDKLEDGTAYLAMERLEGITLGEWLRRRERRVEVKTALWIGEQVASAMGKAHENRIVHRDLKPDNIFLLNADASASAAPTVKVLDFGIAKVPANPTGGVDTQVLTMGGAVFGTVAYMPPEQCFNVDLVDAAADVYSFGVLLFEVLALRLPFVSKDVTELVRMHVQEKPPYLRDLVPEIPPDVSALIDAMLAKVPAERPSMLHCRERLAALREGDQAECPLPGLQPFAERDAALFFGRQETVNDLVDRLELARVGPQRWVLLEGPSGAGKSSLVQAGIRPRLAARTPDDGVRWLVASFRPSDAPLLALAKAMVGALSAHGLEQTAEEVRVALATDSDALRSLAARAPPKYVLLLIIEQMEELFTLGASETATLDTLLHAALVDLRCPLRLLTTLRNDFVPHLQQVPKLAGLLNKAVHLHRLLPMDREALRKVVQGMAQRAGLKLCAPLAGRMVDEAASADCPLPLLGHALRALWSLKGSGNESLEERYEQLGGVGGALSKQATAFFEALSEEERERAKWMILDLVQVTRNEAPTRRTQTFEHVLTAGGKDATANDVLMRLSGVRLDASADADAAFRMVDLSGEPGEDASQQRVDLIHETLLREVRLIERWIDRERLRLEQYADLEGVAAVWEEARCPDVGLPTGAMLERYRGSIEDERRHEMLERMVSARARRFLGAAEEAERQRLLAKQREEEAERRQQEAERRRQVVKHRTMIALAILTAVAFVAAGLAFWQTQIAEKNLHSFISTTDGIVSGVDWELARKSGHRALRHEQLTSIERQLESLPPSERAKPEVRRTMIAAKHRLGDFALIDGSLKDAETYFRSARDELKEIGERASVDKEWQKVWAYNDSKLGKVAMAQERFPEAQVYFEDALTSFKRISKADEDSVRTLATSYAEQGDLDRALEHFVDAAYHYDEAIKLFKVIADENHGYSQSLLAEAIRRFNSILGDGLEYNQSLLAETLGARAAVARTTGDLGLASDLLNKAFDTMKPQRDLGPAADAYYRSILARLHVERGELQSAQNKRPEAKRDFEKARALGQALVEGDPTRKPYALVLGDALRGLERAADEAGDHEGKADAVGLRLRLASRFEEIGKDDRRFENLSRP
jgi:tetratricopeptide (TPR) repeat protein/tRNA A-37 threonylcarbamoyl transferase component Bud32